MKKILLAIALVITMSLGANAQGDGFVADWAASGDLFRSMEILPLLPGVHGVEVDVNAPLGSGLLVLTALGAGYAVARRKREE